MRELTNHNFGLLIAYLLPGFVSLIGISLVSETVRNWIAESAQSGLTVGGFLYTTLASLTLGLIVSTIRWAVIDTLHHRTGINRPHWDFAKLGMNVAAYDVLLRNHYHYYQHYSNMLVAIALLGMTMQFAEKPIIQPEWLNSVGLLVLAAILFAGSRDTLRKYYQRTGQLLSKPESKVTNLSKAALPVTTDPSEKAEYDSHWDTNSTSPVPRSVVSRSPATTNSVMSPRRRPAVGQSQY